MDVLGVAVRKMQPGVPLVELQAVAGLAVLVEVRLLKIFTGLGRLMAVGAGEAAAVEQRDVVSVGEVFLVIELERVGVAEFGGMNLEIGMAVGEAAKIFA